jgi:hypothetical protein
MADLTEDQAPLPPQATGETLPGQAADAAAIVGPPPSAEQAILQANFGDKGAQQYQDLRTAGQRGSPMLPGTPAPPSTGGGDLAILLGGVTDTLGATLTGFATSDPQAGIKLQQRKQAIALQKMEMQKIQQEAVQRAQTMAINDATYVEKLQNEPLDVRASMIQAYAAKQGRDLTPAEARYIAAIDPEHLNHTKMLAEQGDITALSNLKALFGGNPLDMVTAKQDISKRNADANKAIDLAKITHEKVPFAAAPKSPADMAAAQATQEGLAPGSPAYNTRATSLTAQYKAQAELQQASAGASKSDVMTNRADALAQLQADGTIPSTATNFSPFLSQINERAASIAVNKKAPPMTIQRARDQIASVKNVADDLKGMLTDPKFADATKALGPSLTANIGGATIGPPAALTPDTGGLPSYNRAWSNFKNYGGKGNSDDENRLMQAINFFQSTGWQGLAPGIRNPKIISDIQAHLPTPIASAEENLERIGYLESRYGDMIAEMTKGAQPMGAQGAAPKTSAAPNGSVGYSSLADVQAAVRAGALTRDAGVAAARQQGFIQ